MSSPARSEPGRGAVRGRGYHRGTNGSDRGCGGRGGGTGPGEHARGAISGSGLGPSGSDGGRGGRGGGTGPAEYGRGALSSRGLGSSGSDRGRGGRGGGAGPGEYGRGALSSRGLGTSGSDRGRGGRGRGAGFGAPNDRGRGRGAYGSGKSDFFSAPGNWDCFCGYTNFPPRVVCNVCTRPKPVSVSKEATGTSNQKTVPSGPSASSKALASGKSAKAPTWRRDPTISELVRWGDAPSPAAVAKAVALPQEEGAPKKWGLSKFSRPAWNCPDPECNTHNIGYHTRCRVCALCIPPEEKSQGEQT